MTSPDHIPQRLLDLGFSRNSTNVMGDNEGHSSGVAPKSDRSMVWCPQGGAETPPGGYEENTCERRQYDTRGGSFRTR
jgi:hypothetical protein